MDYLPLAETIHALKDELTAAMLTSGIQDEAILFPVGKIELEFNVVVTRSTDPSIKMKFWVIEGGAGTQFKREELHRVTITLDPPVDEHGRPVLVNRAYTHKP